MNLTRMRQFQWEDRILPIYEKNELKILYGDQDLINILFSFHPEKLYVLPCEYNYRPDHCKNMSLCNASFSIQVMHGNRRYFHSEKQPVFSTVYNSIVTYQFGKDPYRHILLNLNSQLELLTESYCGQIKDIILLKPKKIFTEPLYNDDNR